MGLFKKSFIIFTFLYVLFFVKTWGSVTGLLYTHDDVVYYAQTASLVNNFETGIENHLGRYKLYLEMNPQTGKMMSYQPFGPTLLYIVPYLLTKPFVYLISSLRGAAFDEYDPLFFVVLCFYVFIMFYYAGVFLRKTLLLFFDQSISDITVVFTLWGTILPVYVFRRPIFGVIPEFFFSVLLLYLVLRYFKDNKLTICGSAVLGLIAGFLFVTRWNDIYLFILYLPLLAYIEHRSKKGGRWIKAFVIKGAVFLSVALLFFILTQGIIWISTYGSIANFVSIHSKVLGAYIGSSKQAHGIDGLLVNMRNFIHILFGVDWGVIFTMPILVLGGIGMVLAAKLKISHRRFIHIILVLLTFLAPIYIVLKWKTAGEFYGYRFLVTLLPFAALGFSELCEKLPRKYKKIIIYTVFAFCIFNFFVILPFELTEKTSLQENTLTPMGGTGWNNNAYFINAVKFYFESDFKLLISNFLRGYLAAIIFGFMSFFNFDLTKFSPKVSAYFSLIEYKNYLSFVYLLLIMLWVFYLNISSKLSKKIHGR